MGRNKGAWVAVEKLAKCNRCWDEQVAWVQSGKSGKWYLATAYVDGDGFRANRLDPHFKHCAKSKMVHEDDYDCPDAGMGRHCPGHTAEAI